MEQEGVTIKEYVAVQRGGDAINGLLGGSVQAGIIGAEGITAVSKGLDIVSVAAQFDGPPWTVIGGPNVQTWDDLRGKTIGLGSLNDITAVAWSALARAAGYDPEKDFQYVATGATPGRLASLTAGQTDATLVAYPSAAKAVAGGMTDLGLTRDGGPPPGLIVNDVVVKRSWAEANRDCVSHFLRALLRAATWSKDSANRDELIDKTARLQKEDPEYITKMIDIYFFDPVASAPLYPAGFKSRPGLVEETVELYLEVGIIQKPITEAEYRDYSYLDAATVGL